LDNSTIVIHLQIPIPNRIRFLRRHECDHRSY